MPAGPSLRARRRSSFFAAASACSGTKVTMALTFGLTRSILATKARIASTADSLRVRIRRASRRAPVKCSSLMGCTLGDLHQDDVELFLQIARFHLQRNRLADEVGEHRHRRGFLFPQQVDDALRRQHAELARLELARPPQDLAQDLVE